MLSMPGSATGTSASPAHRGNCSSISARTTAGSVDTSPAASSLPAQSPSDTRSLLLRLGDDLVRAPARPGEDPAAVPAAEPQRRRQHVALVDLLVLPRQGEA